jgi:1,4-dihydroxy-2-naphthoate octaprenyltransferase
VKPKAHPLVLFVRLSRPFFLLGGLLLYGLGAAIASYLGRPIDTGLYVVGQALVTSIQLMTHYLNEYYDVGVDRVNPQRTFLTGGSGILGENGLPPRVALYAAVGCLLVTAGLTSLLISSGRASAIAWLVLLVSALTAFFYSAPPLRLVSTGFGELTTSILVAGLVPSFAFALQTGEMHRLLFMSTVPLASLHFAMLLVFELPDWPVDRRCGKRTLVVRLGWASAMRLHDGALLLAYVTLGLAFISGMPARVVVGALLPLPLALLQAWQLRRIQSGAAARWSVMEINALALFALTAYLELIGFLIPN